jgi:hypothetical protein
VRCAPHHATETVGLVQQQHRLLGLGLTEPPSAARSRHELAHQITRAADHQWSLQLLRQMFSQRGFAADCLARRGNLNETMAAAP